ncbi:hypothetical protein ACFSQ7_37665 [Paenibacillus rhizoplanae]
MIVMPVPYNLRVSEEEKIYAKLIGQSDMKHVHIAPHALRAAAIFSILTRLKESKKQGMDLIKKLRMYDGEEVEGYKEADLKEMQTEYLDEGMSGIDPRYVINRISSALIKGDLQCMNALDVLRAIKDGLDQHPSITKEERERYLNFISIARKEYDILAKKRSAKRRSSTLLKNPPKTLFENYLDNIEAFCNWSKNPRPAYR